MNASHGTIALHSIANLIRNSFFSRFLSSPATLPKRLRTDSRLHATINVVKLRTTIRQYLKAKVGGFEIKISVSASLS